MLFKYKCRGSDWSMASVTKHTCLSSPTLQLCLMVSCNQSVISAGKIQLLQTCMLVACNCKRCLLWPVETVTKLPAGLKQRREFVTNRPAILMFLLCCSDVSVTDMCVGIVSHK